MSCMTLFAPTAAMTTTQLVSAICYGPSNSWQMEPTTEREPRLNMSWVVVTDGDGKRRLRIRWALAE